MQSLGPVKCKYSRLTKRNCIFILKIAIYIIIKVGWGQCFQISTRDYPYPPPPSPPTGLVHRITFQFNTDKIFFGLSSDNPLLARSDLLLVRGLCYQGCRSFMVSSLCLTIRLVTTNPNPIALFSCSMNNTPRSLTTSKVAVLKKGFQISPQKLRSNHL